MMFRGLHEVRPSPGRCHHPVSAASYSDGVTKEKLEGLGNRGAIPSPPPLEDAAVKEIQRLLKD